jgi:hypothetical protein
LIPAEVIEIQEYREFLPLGMGQNQAQQERAREIVFSTIRKK